MIARRILMAFSFAVTLIVSTAVALAQSGEPEQPATQSASQGGILDVLEQIKQAQAQRLEGSWDVIVTPVVPPGVPQPPSFHAYGSFARGGAFIGSDRTRPASKQHGVWAHLGGADFAYTFKEDLFDAMGNFAGILTVRVRLTVSGKDDFVGVANGEQRDANGNLIFNRCTTIRGARIKIEPLAEQCQSIMPPQ
ncbi:MAG: hypothetical protein ACREAB_09115 [Blastocatellia bacterium]